MWQQSEKYKNLYRIPSARLRGYDYSANGCYYVTICTKNKEHYFGEIVNGMMQLSETGKIAETEWLKTAELRPDMNLMLDEFVIMPNHFQKTLRPFYPVFMPIGIFCPNHDFYKIKKFTIQTQW